MNTGEVYEFGEFRLSGTDRQLYCAGESVALTAKLFDLLELLVRNRGRALGKSELMQALWPEVTVEENNLTVHMSALRKALRNRDPRRRYIETLPRHGYRWAEQVFELENTQHRTASERPPFAGRSAELGHLQTLLDRAIGGNGGGVLVTGVAGMGKTALVSEFLHFAEARSSRVLCAVGRCQEQYGTSEAYSPFFELIDALLCGPERERTAAALRAYAPTWCVQFPSINTLAAREALQREALGATRARMLRELGDLLQELASQRTVVLALEDLHWSDPSTLDLLSLLCQRAVQRRWLLVLTLRSGEISRHGSELEKFTAEMLAHDLIEELPLPLLGLADISQHLQTRFPANDFPEDFARLLSRETGGHPLFLTRLLQLLAERGDVIRAPQGWALRCAPSELLFDVPQGVRSLIRSKLRSLDERDRRALQYASVEGEEFSSLVLSALLGVDEIELEEQLARIDEVHELIVAIREERLPDGRIEMRYRFVHALYRSALYDALVNKRRRQLHLLAGEELLRQYGHQALQVAARLAWHFEQGLDFERALRHAMAAGDNARRLYAHMEASRYYERALALAGRLAPEAQDGPTLLAQFRLGSVQLAMSNVDRARAAFESALAQARKLDDREQQCNALNMLGQLFFQAHRLALIAPYANEAVRIAEASGNPALLVESLVGLACKDFALGDLTTTELLLERSVAIARTLPRSRALLVALSWRGLLHFFHSEFHEADAVLAEALALNAEWRESFATYYGNYFRGFALGHLGRVSEACAAFDEATLLSHRNGDLDRLRPSQSAAIWMRRELGERAGEIESSLPAAESGASTNAVAVPLNLAEAEISRVLLLEPHEASKAASSPHLHTAEALLSKADWFHWHYDLRLRACRCHQLIESGDLDFAEERCQEVLDLATRYRVGKYLAIAHRLRADLAAARADFTTAEREVRAALGVLEDYPTPILAWRLHAALAHLERKRGAPTALATHAKAATIADSIAANIVDDRLRAIFLKSRAVDDERVPDFRKP